MPIMPYMEKLIEEIENYARLTNVKPNTVVAKAINQTYSRFDAWKSGDGSCSLTNADRIRRYMAENPPQDGAA